MHTIGAIGKAVIVSAGCASQISGEVLAFAGCTTLARDQEVLVTSVNCNDPEKSDSGLSSDP